MRALELENRSVGTDAATFRGEMRRLLVLSAPMIATALSRLAMQSIDFIMVTRLGTDATAALSPASLLVFAALCMGAGLVSSVQTFSSQAMGRGTPREGATYAWQTFYVAGVFLLLAAPLALVSGPFWALVGHTPAVQALETSYCQVAVWCMGFTVLCSGLDAFFNGIQKPKVGLVSILVALVLNGVGNYALIFGHWGLPAMGVRGAALATVLAWGARAAMLTVIFLSSQFDREYGTRSAWRFDWAKLSAMFRLGGPVAVQWVLDIGSWFMFLAVLMKAYGTAAIAASNIGLQYMHFAFMPAIGIGMGLNTLVGHAIGERRPELAALRTRVCLLLTGLFMGAMGLTMFVSREWLMSLFSADPDVIRIGGGVLVWSAVFQVFDAVGITYIFALRGAGDTKWSAAVVIFHCWVVFVLGGFIVSRLAPRWGYHGPWLMCTSYIILLSLALRWRFNRGAWRRIELFAHRDPGHGSYVLPVQVSVPAASESGNESSSRRADSPALS